MRPQLPLTFSLLLALAAAPRAHAGGFEIYEQSPAGTAMAGALTALPGDGSAIFYNPAGIAMQRGGSLLVGGDLAFGSTTITSAGGAVASSRSQSFPLPTVFASGRIGARFAAGIGVFTQFGTGVEFDSATQNGMSVPFPGRFLATSTQLQSVTVNPTLALLATERFALGVGLDVIAASADLRRQIQLGDVEAASHLGGTANAIGWNFGVQAVLIPRRLSLGLAYRSGFDLGFAMNAHFNSPPELATTLTDQPARATLTMPHNFSLGLALHPGRTTTLSAEVHVALWSDFSSLAITFPTTSTPTITAAESWRDTVAVRLGFEWMAVPGFAVRLGAGYDQSPVPATTLGPAAPLNDRILLSGGLGYTLTRTRARGLGIAASYLAALSYTRTSANPDLYGAAYGATAHVVSVALSYRWGAGECDRCGSVAR